MERRRKVVYWAFNIEVLGPRCETKAEDRRVHQALSKKTLQDIEEAAKSAAQGKLPPGFTARLSG